MKVLEICPFMNLGGTERHLYNLVMGLRDRFEVAIVAPPGPAREDFMRAGFRIFDYPSMPSISPGGVRAVVGHLRGLFQREGPDLVHVHAAREMVALARLAGGSVPLAFTPHVYTSSLDFLNTSFWARFADWVICVSNWEKRRLDHLLGRVPFLKGAPRTVRIYNGIPLPGISCREVAPLRACEVAPSKAYEVVPLKAISDGPVSARASLVIGCVARLHRAKGVDLLIRAFSDLSRRLGEGGPDCG